MNADAIRHFYGYHFAENRTIWDKYISQLTDEQFIEGASYSHGSVRNQVVHLIAADEAWFSDLRGVALSDPDDLEGVNDREKLRRYWDGVEADMRAYLDALTDDMLASKPFPPGEDENLVLWQVLLHVANHGTDHRAQILNLLNRLGVETVSQDYIFYVYKNP